MTTRLTIANIPPTFTVPVPIPQAGGGKPIEIDIEFKRMRKTIFDDWLKYAGDQKTSYLALASEIVVGWDGPDKPFSKEALEELLETYHQAAISMVRVFCKQLAGIDL